MKYDVVIVGAGFAGLATAKKLKKTGKSICLIDKTNHHLFQPLLYQVATAALSEGNIAHPIREVFKKSKNVTTLLAEVTDISLPEQQVILNSGQQIAYQYLVLAPGARHQYFNHPEWEQAAPGLKTLDDALQVRNKILQKFEQAELIQEHNDQNPPIHFVIVGGGPTGVELAGSIAEIAHESLVKEYRHIDTQSSKIYLVEAGDQLLNGYPKHLAQRAQADLAKMQVDVLLNHRVTALDNNQVEIINTQTETNSVRVIQSDCVLWAAGNMVSPLVRSLALESDASGRVKVEVDCSIPNYPNCFIIGDSAFLTDSQTQMPVPAIAPAAKQMGEFVAKVIKKDSLKQQRPRFRYKDMGMMATIGKFKAVVLSGPFKSTGLIAWMMWGVVHIYFLINFRSRMIVFLEWMFYFFKGQRNQRLIIERSIRGIAKPESNSS